MLIKKVLTVFCILAVASLFATGCDNGKATWLNWKAKAPSNPGTAETLIDTQWDFGPNSVLFEADSKCVLAAQGSPMPLGEATWSVDKGVVTVKMNDKTIVTATWDGTTLVANGFAATQVVEETTK